jgi:hypothetical protein
MNMQKPPVVIVEKTSRPGFIEFETAIETVGLAPDHMNRARPTPNNGGKYGASVSTYHKNLYTIQDNSQLMAQEYDAKTIALPQTIENELAAVRLEGSTEQLPPVQAILRELDVRNTLTQRIAAEFHDQTAIANEFFGGSPFNRHVNDFMTKATTIEKRPGPDGIAMQAWYRSYRAAHNAQLLSQSLTLLSQQQVNVQNFLMAAQAEEQARAAAEQEAQRVAAELARINEEAEVRAREQARLAALEEARQAAEEQARIAAEAAAQQIAAERAHLEALAELQRLEELRQAEENARKTTLAMGGSTAAAGPLFAGTAGTLVVSQATSLAIRSALQSALTATVSTAVGSAGAVASGFAALVYPSPLGNSDLYSLSVPLSDLSPATDQNLSAHAPTSGQVKLTVGIGSKADGSTIEYFVVATNGTTVPYDVPVQLATYDPIRKVYTTQSPGLPSIGMTWTPIVQPGDASTTLPSTEPGIVVYEGATVTALEGRIDAFPELDLDSLGGFITVFPADSGIPPIYTMFRDRRNEPGVANGSGQTASGNWVGNASTSDGAPVPQQIADTLREREFSSFNAFRKAFWKAVANDQTLLDQFSLYNKSDIKNGLSPSVPASEQVGGRKKLEIHHTQPISEGGAVYDMDNLRILTPKQHIQIHSSKGGTI